MTAGEWTRRILFAGSLVALSLMAPGGAGAHNLGDSYLYLRIYEDTVSGRFEVALSDLNPALGLTGTPLEITPETVDERAGFLKDYYLEHVTISDVRGPLEIHFEDDESLQVRAGYVLLPFELPGLDAVPDEITINYSVLFDEEPSHRGFLIVEHNWSTGTFANENQVSLVFSPGNRRQEFDLTSSGRLRGFLALLWLGAEHLWLGLDHLMFLVALLLPIGLRRENGNWSPVVGLRVTAVAALKIVTAFLVAHSLTLCLAALGWLRLPERLVETAIAASVWIAALHLLVPVIRGRFWWTVFGLSLFHGLGFAGGLNDLGVLEDHRGMSLLAFNLGVDLALVVITPLLALPLFLLGRWNVFRRWLMPIGAIGMILVSSVWIIERAFLVNIPMRELLPRSLQKVLP